jgi:PAS domain S-box-containing protein
MRRCLAEGETLSTTAYAIGRKAVAGGLGVLDMARLHHRALLEVLPIALEPEERAQAGEAAEELFLASLAPFENTLFRSTNAALRVSEERYRRLFDNAHDIIFTLDLAGNFTSINQAGERLSGYERREALTMNFTSVVAPEHREVARFGSQATLLRDKENTRCEMDMVTKEGRRIPLEVNTRVIFQDGRPIGVQGIARDITERKRAEQALRGLTTRFEEEAKRIAHALHDEAGQLLASVYLAVTSIASELPEPAGDRVRGISTILDGVAEQLRHLSHELRPIMLDDLGLIPALEFLVQGFSARTGVDVTMDVSIPGRLRPSVETDVYRILQESLNNVSKHAQAKQVCVTLRQDDREIRCLIADDGIGFDSSVGSNGHTTGLGLIGIRDRLAALGGTLVITATSGRGTTLDVKIPLET